MVQQINKETVKVEALEIAKLRVRRTEKGVLIDFHSPRLAEFFKSLAGGKAAAVAAYNGALAYSIEPGRLPVVRDVQFNALGQPLILPDRSHNLSFFRLVDVEKGISIAEEGAFINSHLTNLYNTIRRAVGDIFLEYLCTFDQTGEFSFVTTINNAA